MRIAARWLPCAATSKQPLVLSQDGNKFTIEFNEAIDSHRVDFPLVFVQTAKGISVANWLTMEKVDIPLTRVHWYTMIRKTLYVFHECSLLRIYFEKGGHIDGSASVIDRVATIFRSPSPFTPGGEMKSIANQNSIITWIVRELHCPGSQVGTSCFAGCCILCMYRRNKLPVNENFEYKQIIRIYTAGMAAEPPHNW
jgi:hypothetical protein